MYNLNPVILSHYFRQYKGVALGINYCGSTVAAMVFPKFMEFLYKEFGLRGDLLDVLMAVGVLRLATPSPTIMFKRRTNSVTSWYIPGLFLIYAAIMLNTPVISYLMHKPSWTKRKMRAPDIGREFIRRMTNASVRDSRAQSTVCLLEEKVSTILLQCSVAHPWKY